MTPTDLETLRGLGNPVEMLKAFLADLAEQGPQEVRFTSIERDALTALLADYERMREWILAPMSVHQAECATSAELYVNFNQEQNT